MNNSRRKRISKIADALNELKGQIDELYEEEQEAFENIPESLQGTERYEVAENAVDIPPEEMSEAQIREQLDAEYKHWDDLKKNGCSDPAWPDGVNLNLVRNHIIYWYRLLRERTSQTVQLSMFDAGMDLRNERPLPPEVPDRYMVPTGKYPDRLNGKWDGLIFDPTI